MTDSRSSRGSGSGTEREIEVVSSLPGAAPKEAWGSGGKGGGKEPISAQDPVAWAHAPMGQDDLPDVIKGASSNSILSKGAIKKKQTQKLGTFKGVFVPTLQNILGIILFLRLPKITGHAGIGCALAIVLMSCMATFLTSLSMSAVATNGVPKGGGCYSIIKESIGPEFGGTVGLLLFFSNNFGVAMYVIGFVEILEMLGVLDGIDVGGDRLNTYRVVGCATLLCLFSIVFVGIKYIARFAILFLSVVGTAIICIYIGVIDKTVSPTDDIPGFPSNLGSNFGPKYGQDEDGKDYSFAVLLAIFFPAVTDPLAGSNLSGDLANPQKSIPPGTLIAVVVTTIIFSLQVIFTGASCDRDYLRFDTGGTVVSELAWPVKQIVYLGMCTSTLGAGLQSLAGAPRLLAAIARDELIPQLRIFAPKDGGEPRLALCLCGFLSLCCIMLGRLELVAPFITMWFLACYAVINGAAAYLGREDAIHFRPRWKYYHWSTSLLGAMQCGGMMFFIKPLEAAIAIAIGFCIYKYIQRTISGDSDNGKQGVSTLVRGVSTATVGTVDSPKGDGIVRTDWQAGRRFHNVRRALLSVESGDFQYKYWRPFILYLGNFSADDDGSGRLTRFSSSTDWPTHGLINIISQFNKRGKGLAVVGGVITGDSYRDNMVKIEETGPELSRLLAEKGVEGFPEIVSASSVYEGYRYLISGSGLGVLRPNTVMMGWPPNIWDMTTTDADKFTEILGDIKSAGKTLLLCRANDDWPDELQVVASTPTATIDVWWIFDLFPADGLLLVFPFLLLQHNVWAGCKMRIFIVTPPEAAHGIEKERLKKTVEEFLDAGGVLAAVNVIIMNEDEAPRYKRPTEKEDDTIERGSVSSAVIAAPQKFGEEALPTPGNQNFSISLQRKATNHEGDEVDVDLEHPHDRGKRRSIWAERDDCGSRLTNVMATESGASELVFITLPPMQSLDDGPFSSSSWLQSVETLVCSLKRVIFIQQSGTERVQFFV